MDALHPPPPNTIGNTVNRMITDLKTLNANISFFYEKIIPSNLFKKGDANLSLHSSLGEKGPLAPPLVTGLIHMYNLISLKANITLD